MLNKLMGNLYLLPIWVCVYPVAFLYSQNTNMASVPDFMVNLGFMLFCSLVMLVITACLKLVVGVLVRNNRTILQLFNCGVAGAYVLVLFTFSYVPLRPYFPDAYLLATTASFLSILIAFVVFYTGLRWLNTFLGILCLLAFLQIGFSLSQRDTEGLVSSQEYDCIFKKKPDIFVILAESYNSFEEQEKSYGLTNTKLKAFLRDKGFSFKSIYSNYDHTFATALAMFLMEHHYNNKLTGNKDVTYGIRGLVNGGRNNPALNILKKNGYFIALMDQGLFTNKGVLVDYMPENKEALPILVAEMLTIPRSFRYTGLFFNVVFYPFLGETKYSSTAGYLEKAFEYNVEKKPGFYFTRDGAAHTKGAHHVKEKDWIPQYREFVDSGDQNIIDFINVIEKHSPDSVIIVIGDHGSYRTATVGRKPVADVKQEVINDLYQVLFALRLPKGMELPTEWNSTALSHVNIFRKIFSLLSNDRSLLKGAEKKTHSIGLDGKVLAIDGKPQ